MSNHKFCFKQICTFQFFLQDPNSLPFVLLGIYYFDYALLYHEYRIFNITVTQSISMKRPKRRKEFSKK